LFSFSSFLLQAALASEFVVYIEALRFAVSATNCGGTDVANGGEKKLHSLFYSVSISSHRGKAMPKQG
jgi:hypothetical protein